MYLAATAWIYNEAPYLEEWVEFHIKQGFDKFYLYDNKSTDNTRELMAKYSQVEIRNYPPEITTRKNFWVMDHTINEFKGKHKWLFHHSIDEYMFCLNRTKVSEFLKDYEDFGGVIVPWLLFNSGGQQTKLPGKVVDRFIHYMDDPNKHIKTIIQPDKAIKNVGNPHAYKFIDGCYAVDANKNKHETDDKLHGGAMGNDPYLTDDLRIHHYVTMSREEFDVKMSKGLLDNDSAREGIEKFWDDHHVEPWKIDTSLREKTGEPGGMY